MYMSFESKGGEYDAIPEITRHNLLTYVREGRRGGHFLTAVLTNDLQKACAHADDDNAKALTVIVKWLFNRAPQACWGSQAAVEAWCAQGGLREITRAP